VAEEDGKHRVVIEGTDLRGVMSTQGSDLLLNNSRAFDDAAMLCLQV
jgi:hypothetical protein